ncbi:MAG TPA: copper resistance system multicopper oxidase [Gemmatimonadaceae bacterium]
MTQPTGSFTQTAVTRRDFVRAAGAFGAAAALHALLPEYASASLPAAGGVHGLHPHIIDGVAVYDLTIAEQVVAVAGRRGTAVMINGTIPGPLLTLQEGQETIIRVHNRLREDTSVHWHGVIVPPEMDGVPGVSFPGIPPGTTFEYRFPLKQYGTYWYHSHSGLQEQLGHYGPLVIHPAGGYPYQFDREYIVVLSDWTFENPYRVLDRLKKQGNYYNFQRRTVGDFLRDVARDGFMPTLRERLMWLQMRMDPTDLQDVTGATYTYLVNGLAPGANWTGLFRPGERVLLRFINASADSMFDVRIPDLPMTVVQASGQFVQPIETDEFRITNAETYDVVVEPGDRPYTIFAESTDRSGYTRGTLTPRVGWNAPIPARRKRPLLTMADMGMAHGDMAGMGDMAGASAAASGHTMAGMVHATMGGTPAPAATQAKGADMTTSGTMAGMTGMAGMSDAGSGDRARYAVAGVSRTQGLRPPGTVPGMLDHEPTRHSVENGAVPMMVSSRLAEPGTGLGEDGWRVLLYTDLKAVESRPDFRAPDREIEIHLTGNMERFMWSINGRAFSPGMSPVRLNYGERVRLTMVNDTMMNHPMHLHGMWMELENGHLERIPRVHTVNVKPAERLSLLITADAPGRWAFHCHIMYHMLSGMFRVFEVSQPGRPFTPEELNDVP